MRAEELNQKKLPNEKEHNTCNNTIDALKIDRCKFINNSV